MFKRRQPLPYYLRLREFFWPRRGLRRTSVYIAHRLRRLPGTPYRIAAGFTVFALLLFLLWTKVYGHALKNRT